MLLEFLRCASREKYEFTLCVLLERGMLNEEAEKLGIETVSLNLRNYWDLSAWWKLYRFAKKRKFDLIRTYGLKAEIIGRIVGKLLGIPVNITSVRSTDPWRTWYHSWLDSLTSGLTDLYLSNSEAGRMATHRRERIPLSKIMTIPNGVDLSKWRWNIFPTCHNSFGISSSIPVIGIVANLGRVKGHTTIIDALPRIQRHFPDVKCLLVGRDDLHGEIQGYVREKHFEDTVIFTGVRHDIPEILSLLDVFLLPSLWEGFPTALLEAMAMKKPVVASDVGGIPEMVESGKTGLLIPPGDPDALAEAVIFLLQHPERASEMGEAAYNKVRQDFSLDTLVARTEEIYEHLIMKKTAVKALKEHPVIRS